MGLVKITDEKEKQERKKEKEDKEKAKKTKEAPKKKMIEGVRGIVRVAEADLDGTKKVRNSILRVKGIGKSLAPAILKVAGIDPEALLGSLSEERIEKLEEVLRNPSNFGIPPVMLNRPKEQFTGETRHLIASDLTMAIKSDIDFMKKIRSYKGVRHELGLPVRGQRTRSSFRTGMIVGVARKAARLAARAPEAKPGAPAAPGAPAPAAPAKAEAAKPGAPGKPAAPAKPEAKKEEKK